MINNIFAFARKGYSAEMSIAAGIRAYNAGDPSQSALKKASAGNIGALDRGTTEGNYVTNILALWNNCFPN